MTRSATEQTPSYFLHPDISVGDHCTIGTYSVVGEDLTVGSAEVGSIGNQVTIGSHSWISASSRLDDGVEVDSFCRVGPRTTVGELTKILYGAQIFADCKIGAKCIISGEIPNRVVIEDNVTFMGDIAHTYRDASIAWDTIEEPSPRILRGSVVGMRALLIGPVTIGPGSYVAAGEIVRHDIPSRSVFYRGEVSDIDDWRGYIRARDSE